MPCPYPPPWRECWEAPKPIKYPLPASSDCLAALSVLSARDYGDVAGSEGLGGRSQDPILTDSATLGKTLNIALIVKMGQP